MMHTWFECKIRYERVMENEMKKKGGYQSPSQKQWQKMICENREYKYVVCHSLDDFIREVDEFLKNAELWDEM